MQIHKLRWKRRPLIYHVGKLPFGSKGTIGYESCLYVVLALLTWQGRKGNRGNIGDIDLTLSQKKGILQLIARGIGKREYLIFRICT